MEFKSVMEKQSGHSIIILKTGRGGEFKSKESNIFYKEHGLKDN